MKFKDIIGHEEAKNRLRNMVRDNQLPHALLLSGHEGIGKLALARAFSQYLHCTHRTPDGDSCGVCPSCLQHSKHNYPDMHYAYPVAGTKGGKPATITYFIPQWYEFLDNYPLAPYEKWLSLIGSDNAQPQIKVGDAQEIINKVALSNYLAEYKVIIVWLPEKLNLEGANKLLKSIEEPAPGNIFIFVSDAPERILPTIYSRLQRIELGSPSAEAIAGYLEHTKSMDAEAAMSVARSSEGNVQRALEMVELGGENAEFLKTFQELMRSAYKADVTALRKWSEDVAAMKREKSRRFLSYCTRMARENFLYNLRYPELLSLSPDEAAFSQRFAPFIHEGNIAQIMNELDLANRDIAANGNARIILFDLALQMIILIKTKKPI